MNYETFPPHPYLQAAVKCYWSLEVAAESGAPKQRIIPDGCIEMAFILGDDIKRYTSETEFILQPRAMVLGQITEPFYIEPTGYVNTFAIRFYPYGFANFVNTPINDLANKETPIDLLFGKKTASELEQKIIQARDTKERIEIIEDFFLEKIHETTIIEGIVSTTIDALLSSKGSVPVLTILKDDVSKRRQLERNFLKLIGMSPGQLGKVIRLQAALKALLTEPAESLTQIAYDNEYYDQSHFIRDFKEFTGTTPKKFLSSEEMALSSLIYKKS